LKQQSTPVKDTILTVNVVEPGLVRAVRLHSERLGKPLKGVVLVHKDYANQPGRPRDKTGLFKEIVCDFNNPNELQRAVRPYADNILAATCRVEETVQFFGKVLPFLPYIHKPSESALSWSTEKPLMRDFLRNYDGSLVPQYQYMEASDVQRADKLIKDFAFPLIIKPAGLSKALLVTRNEDMKELRANLARTFDVINDVYQRLQSPGKPGVLVEEMMQGDMYSIDSYVSHDGRIWHLPPAKVITSHSLGLPGFYGYDTLLPSGLTEKETEVAFAAASAAIKALNLSTTTAHIELFHTRNGWKIIEIAARIGGFRDTLYREAYGIEHFYNDLAIHMGQEPDIPRELLRYTQAINIYAATEGRITSIEGIEEARELPGMAEIDVKIPPGELALFVTEGGDPVVKAVISNEDPKQLEKDARRVRELVRINVRPSQQLAIRRARSESRQSTQNTRVLK
jgi:biotin carboxylase